MIYSGVLGKIVSLGLTNFILFLFCGKTGKSGLAIHFLLVEGKTVQYKNTAFHTNSLQLLYPLLHIYKSDLYNSTLLYKV